MARPALLDTVQRLAEPVVTSKGLQIWGIDILQASRPVVRIYVDVPSGESQKINTPVEQLEGEEDQAQISATVDQCAEISRTVGLAMEVEDVFSSAYVLEVSSPGLSRPFFHLDQLRSYVGDSVEAVLSEALPGQGGRKKFRGRLLSVDDTSFRLEVEAGEGMEEVSLEWDSVRKAARIHVFVTPEKPGKKRKDDK